MEAAQIYREMAPHYFPTDCFGGSSNLEGTGSTLFSDRLFWKFGGNWLHIIFRQIVLEAAQIWRELAPHYFSTDCFGGSSNLEGTGSTLFSDRLFLRQLKFGENWLHIIFQKIVLEAAQIRRELALHYFQADCFGNLEGTGSTIFFRQIVSEAQIWWKLAPYYFPTDCFEESLNLEVTGSPLFSDRLFFEAAQIWRELAPHYFLTYCFGGSSNL